LDFPKEDESDMICDLKKQEGSVLVADGDNHLGKQLAAMIDKITSNPTRCFLSSLTCCATATFTAPGETRENNLTVQEFFGEHG